MANQQPGNAPPDRVYCSRQSDEPMAGTADTVDVWICLEYRPTWKAKALGDNALAEGTREWLTGTQNAFAAAGIRCRPQFIRQPETESDRVRLLLSVDGCTYQFSGQGYDYLEDLDLPALVSASRSEGPDALEQAAERLHAPQYLVCTNGQRDLCCARFGLPVYAALRERVGVRAWQATHLGGHRFAPNLLTFPDACLYGRIDVESIDDFLALTETGKVEFTHLRGRTAYPAVVQAAEATLARQGLRLLHVQADEETTSVQFADAAQRLTVQMGRAEQPARVLKSCADEEAVDVYPFIRI